MLIFWESMQKVREQWYINGKCYLDIENKHSVDIDKKRERYKNSGVEREKIMDLSMNWNMTISF